MILPLTMQSSSALSLSHSHEQLFMCYNACTKVSSPVESFSSCYSNNMMIASLRVLILLSSYMQETIAELSSEKQDLMDSVVMIKMCKN